MYGLLCNTTIASLISDLTDHSMRIAFEVNLYMTHETNLDSCLAVEGLKKSYLIRAVDLAAPLPKNRPWPG